MGNGNIAFLTKSPEVKYKKAEKEGFSTKKAAQFAVAEREKSYFF